MRDQATLPGNGHQLRLISNNPTPQPAPPPPSWVLLDADGAVVDVADRLTVLNYTIAMTRQGVGFAVEPIGDRCPRCGTRPQDDHPTYCSR